MKKTIYAIACGVCAVLIAAVLFAIVVVPMQARQADKWIIGTWCTQTFEGMGTQYATFSPDGSVHLYAEITMADGSTITQDSAAIGSMRYEIADRKTIRFSTTVMGITDTQEVSFGFKGKDTLLLDGESYTRQTPNNDK